MSSSLFSLRRLDSPRRLFLVNARFQLRKSRTPKRRSIHKLHLENHARPTSYSTALKNKNSTNQRYRASGVSRRTNKKPTLPLLFTHLLLHLQTKLKKKKKEKNKREKKKQETKEVSTRLKDRSGDDTVLYSSFVSSRWSSRFKVPSGRLGGFSFVLIAPRRKKSQLRQRFSYPQQARSKRGLEFWHRAVWQTV